MQLFVQEQLVRFIHGEDKELVVAVDTPYDRLLLHGLSQVLNLQILLHFSCFCCRNLCLERQVCMCEPD